MNGLTPDQEEYFRILERMNPDDKLRRAIRSARHDLGERDDDTPRDNINRGMSRVRGFSIEPDTR